MSGQRYDPSARPGAPWRSAVAFLTCLGGAREPTPGALVWFPVVGVGLGAGLGGLWWVASGLWPAPVAAAVVVAADPAVTGMLHFDGLADAADGLLPHLERNRRLEVMATPDVGAFGLGVGAATLLLRFAALAVLRPSPLLLAGLWCLARTAMALAATTQPYARVGGLASGFLGGGTRLSLTAGLLAGVGLTSLAKFPAGAAAAPAGALAAVAVVGLARRRLGGFTGDVLGAAGVLSETAGLLVAAARW